MDGTDQLFKYQETTRKISQQRSTRRMMNVGNVNQDNM